MLRYDGRKIVLLTQHPLHLEKGLGLALGGEAVGLKRMEDDRFEMAPDMGARLVGEESKFVLPLGNGEPIRIPPEDEFRLPDERKVKVPTLHLPFRHVLYNAIEFIPISPDVLKWLDKPITKRVEEAASFLARICQLEPGDIVITSKLVASVLRQTSPGFYIFSPDTVHAIKESGVIWAIPDFILEYSPQQL